MSSETAAAAQAALRAACSIPLEEAIVLGCIDTSQRVDALFARAFTQSRQSLPLADRRGALAGITGHVAESVIEVVLSEYGWSPIWHFVGPGWHGVDLLLLDPGGERLFALEVKGTLQRRWPRLRRGELEQMSRDWLEKSDNPGMADWDLSSADVYGGVAFVNFNACAYRVALSPDLDVWKPVERIEQLDDTGWLVWDWAPDPRSGEDGV